MVCRLSPRRLGLSARVAIGAACFASLAWPGRAHALDPWETLAPLPEPAAQRLAVSSPDEGIYLFGGRGAAQSAARYDPDTDEYEALAELPVATTGACGDRLSDGRIAVYGGADPVTFNYVEDVQLYDPDADAWTLGAVQDGTWACAAVADDEGRLHVFGGQSQQTRYAIYDAGDDSWSLGPAIPQDQRRYAHVAARDPAGRFLLFGGRFSEDTWSMFDPNTMAWSVGGQLPAERVWAAGAVHDDAVFILGGSDNAFNDEVPMFDTVWSFDLASQVWDTDHEALPAALRELSAASYDGGLHVFGGSDGDLVDSHFAAGAEPGGGTGTGTGGEDGGSSTGGDDSGEDSTGSSGQTDGGMSTTGGDDTGADAGDSDEDDGGSPTGSTGGQPGLTDSGGEPTGTDSGSSGGAQSTEDGCSCRQGGGRTCGWLVMLGVVLAWRRRGLGRASR